MTWLPYSADDVAAIAAAMDLRTPNRAALDVLAQQVQDGDGREVVADLATGVGKTYLAAGMVDYLAQQGVRNVLVVVPSAAILQKTIRNFTPGDSKYVAGASVEPMLITSENFARGEVGDALHDARRLKLFVFTVQTLIAPTAKANRKAYKENENIGDALYAHLQTADDLVVLVDEHHVIREKAKRFNAAVHELGARAVIGLTATPDAGSLDKIVYRYSLAEAIADRLVKIPTIVYREDGRKDLRTRLADACQLRRLKEPHWEAYAQAAGRRPVRPIIFVVADRIDDANEIADELRADDLLPGEGEVLVVTGESKETDLQALARVEDMDSPVRAIVSVDKLKEGWDVANIGVIMARRTLASETLTEQILGRGLRLPYGHRTDVPAIDQVDIVAHESYRKLLAQKDALLEKLTSDVNPKGADDEQDESAIDFTSLLTPTVSPEPAEDDESGRGFAITAHLPGRVSDRLDGTSDADLLLAQEMGDVARRDAHPTVADTMPHTKGLEPVVFPSRRLSAEQPLWFSLDSVDESSAEARGRAFSSDPEVRLNRVALNATRDIHGQAHVTHENVEAVAATRRAVAGADIRDALTKRLLHSGIVEPDFTEALRAQSLVERFLSGAGVDLDADWEWSVDHAERAQNALIDLVRTARAGLLQRREVTYKWHPVTVPVPRPRPTVVRTEWDTFVKGAWVGPMKRSIDQYAAFDSGTAELALAQKLETWSRLACWNRIYTHTDAYIPWGGGRRYYVDFVIVDADGTYWAIETKSDKDAKDSEEVKQKALAAEKWARDATATLQFGTWRYRLCTETQIKQAVTWEQLVGGAGSR